MQVFVNYIIIIIIIDRNFTDDNGSANSTNIASVLVCDEGFIYIEELGQCRPHCPSWDDYEREQSITYKVVFLTSSSVGVSASIVMLFTSCLRYKKM